LQIFWKIYVTPGVLTVVALTMAFITAGASMGCVVCPHACWCASTRLDVRTRASTLRLFVTILVSYF
jgi:hypothetical protein